MTKPKQGGYRENAGRKEKYGEPTKRIGFRVPESKVDEITELVKNKLKMWLK